jgi:hypothetical protein
MVGALLTQINDPESKEEDNLHATDNAISSIVHIGRYQNRPELLPLWLSYLPLGTPAYHYIIVCCCCMSVLCCSLILCQYNNQ